MKNKARVFPLLIAVLLAFLLLLGYGYGHLQFSENFPSDKELLSLLQTRDPNNFWRQLAEATGKKEVDHQLIYSTFSRFSQMARSLPVEDKISIDAIKGALLARLHYFDQALVDLKHVVVNSRSTSETRKSLLILAEIYEQLNDFAAVQKTEEQLRLTGEAFRSNKPDNHQEKVMQQKALQKMNLPYYLSVWLLLLIFPAAITEIERRCWLKKIAGREDLSGPFIAFIYSPMCSALVAISGIVFLVVQIPDKLQVPGKYGFLFLHLLVTWLFCQGPLYILENYVKSGKSSFPAYCLERIRLLALNHLPVIAAFFTFLILHFMVVGMPIWPVLRPVGATVAPPALFAVWLILLQWLLPYALGFKRYKNVKHQPRAFACGKGYRRGIIDIGSLGYLSVPIICGGLENELEDEELALLLERSYQKITCGWLFFDFLLLFLFAMIAAMVVAYDPFVWSRFFLKGPGIVEAGLVAIVALLCNSTRKHFTRVAQTSVYALMAADGKTGALIKVLEKVNNLNFFPESLREGDHNEFEVMSLDETRLTLRNADGIYFPPTSRPDCSVLVSLWRCRLAVDWRLGSEEAIHLTALDYSVGDEGIEKDMCALANRHSRLGAECVYKKETQELVVVFCCQKFSAFTAETPLPQQKICEICSEAMKKVLHSGEYTWQNTEKGCILTRQPAVK